MPWGVVGAPRRTVKRPPLRSWIVGVRAGVLVAVFGVRAAVVVGRGAERVAEVGPAAGLRAWGVLGLWITLPS